jgi:integrase
VGRFYGVHKRWQLRARWCRGLLELRRPREDVGRLIAKTPTKYRTLVAVSVLLGLRQSEARGLRWQDLDTQTGVIHVRWQLGRDGELAPLKTPAAKRDIPMPPSLAKTFAAYRLASPYSMDSDYVFASEAGTPLVVRNIIRRGLETALAAAELPKLTWHDLRHLAASLLIAEGASVGYVSRLLGHATPAITLSLYAHEFAKAEHDDHTRERVEAAFGSLL